jgi:predicted lysophospholipase L1 biosynthesis ABC-type transport system permease subunit
MASSEEPLQTLSEIRDLMQRSSKFLSLSGLSGISAGIVALVGAAVAYLRIKTHTFDYNSVANLTEPSRREIYQFILLDGACVLMAALLFGVFFTIRKARKSGHSVWNDTSKRMLISLFVPLATGGLFCIALFLQGIVWVSFPATLIFYGLALVNASKYTHRDVEYLGLLEITLGLLSLFIPGYNLFIWAFGFGVLHLIYGTLMYLKYDKNA